MADWPISSSITKKIDDKMFLAIVRSKQLRAGSEKGFYSNAARIKERDRVWIYDADAKQVLEARSAVAQLAQRQPADQLEQLKVNIERGMRSHRGEAAG